MLSRPNNMGDVIPFAKEEPLSPGPKLHGHGQEGFDENHKRIVQAELRKLLQSPVLVQSDRLCRFLSFAVEATLNGNADSIKEYTIGIEAYGRRPDFDPSQDSIVRTEARRLRTKLKKYYQEEGGNDPILIEFYPGSYVPAFRVNRAVKSYAFDAFHRESLLSRELAICVMPFTHLPGDVFGEACARGLTDDLTHRLTLTEGIRVFALSSPTSSSFAAAKNNRTSESWITSEGCVRTEGKHVRVTSRLYDGDGFHVASWRFDEEVRPDELFSSLEKIATEIVTCIDTRKTMSLAGEKLG